MTTIITGILLLGVCLGLTNTEYIYPVEHEDGNCTVPAPNAVKLSDTFVRDFFSKTMYAPMASAMFYQSMHVIVNEKSTKTSELSKLCLKSQHKPPHTHKLFAGPNSKELKCEFESEGIIDCKENDIILSRFTAIWTNYKDVILWVGCLATGKRTWVAVSNNQTLSPEVVESIQGQIHQAHKFDKTKTLKADYRTC